MVERRKTLAYADKMAQKYKSYHEFIASINTNATKANYAESMRRFVKFHKITDYDKLLEWDSEKITDKLLEWVDSMTDDGLKGVTIRAQLSGPELFFQVNRKLWHKVLVRKRIRSDEDIPGGDEPYTTEDISRMLSATKQPRTIALVHFLASCGIRPGGFVDPVLRMKHLEQIEDCFSVEIYAGTRFSYWVFLTPEASKAMKNYLEWRKLKNISTYPESPLFASFAKKPRKNKKRKTKHYEYLTDSNVDSIIRHLLVNAGITRKKGSSERYDKAALYGFRKRYDTILKETNDINLLLAEKMMAHKTPKEIKLDKNYFRPNRERCFVEFKKAVKGLTIDPSERKEAENQKLRVENTEIHQLKNRTSELERVIELMKKYPKK